MNKSKTLIIVEIIKHLKIDLLINITPFSYVDWDDNHTSEV